MASGGGSSLMPILLLGGVVVGGYFFMKECTGVDDAGVKKDCFGGGDGGGGGGGCSSNTDCAAGETCVGGFCQSSGGGGCLTNADCATGQTCAGGVCTGGGGGGGGGGNGCSNNCTNGFKHPPGSCTCVCNYIVKGCNSNQVTNATGGPCRCVTCPTGSKANRSTNSCVCTSACPPGTTRIPGQCGCKANDPCANKSCGTGYKKVAQNGVCNCICQVTCGGCTMRVANNSVCKCVQNQGSSGNCGWDGNMYTWRAKDCRGVYRTKTTTGNCSKDASSRNNGCATARTQWCNAYAYNPSGCKAGNGTGCLQQYKCCEPVNSSSNCTTTSSREACCTWRGNHGGCRAPTPYGRCTPSNSNCTGCLCSSK